jgi:hypothetical protein
VLNKGDSYGIKSGNGSWNGMVALVMSGIAHVGVGDFGVTKERSEVTAYTKPLGFSR